ncbi:bacillithiol biosynthesis deacetylase BshB1 [Peptococcaceae bacterium 1198_IL3148]
MEKIDILAIGAHPDDIELGVGGIIASAVRTGYKVGMVDLTKGEKASGGTAKQRDQEAMAAAKILNVAWRKNLNIADREIEVTRDNINKLVHLIRIAKPILILAPFWQDRHPDHIKASQLVKEAQFDAGLCKVNPQIAPHKVPITGYYCLNQGVTPLVVIDISSFYKVKLLAINAHHSQFADQSQGIFTLINNRDRYYGSLIGVEYGEGLLFNEPLAVKDLSILWNGKE